ncbi:MAG: hypothetical protein FD180_3018 [Planctomycetota bacterium]|nr:MAG: hypothetical protein FD180_3018 [Planctomycetota bacterium]
MVPFPEIASAAPPISSGCPSPLASFHREPQGDAARPAADRRAVVVAGDEPGDAFDAWPALLDPPRLGIRQRELTPARDEELAVAPPGDGVGAAGDAADFALIVERPDQDFVPVHEGHAARARVGPRPRIRVRFRIGVAPLPALLPPPSAASDVVLVELKSAGDFAVPLHTVPPNEDKAAAVR